MGVSSETRDSESQPAAYVEALAMALGHAARGAPFRSYCIGLLLPVDRKSVEPMAARVAPGRMQAAHQSLHRFVAKANWSDAAVLAAARDRVVPLVERCGAIRGWMIDILPSPRRALTRSALPGNTAPSLASRTIAVASHRPCEPADRAPALPAAGLGG